MVDGSDGEAKSGDGAPRVDELRAPGAPDAQQAHEPQELEVLGDANEPFEPDEPQEPPPPPPATQAKPSPALGANAAPPTTSVGAPVVSVRGPSASMPNRAAGPPVSSSTPRGATGRRPIVDPSRRKKRREPFYDFILRAPRIVKVAVVLVAVILPAAWFGVRALDRARHADSYAVQRELFEYKFDQSESHFAAIDAMGPKGVQFAIGFLGDLAPAMSDNGRSTTTTTDLAHQYLIHYAHKVGLEPPAKGVEIDRDGAIRQHAADWDAARAQWTTWLADAQAKGKT